MHPVESSYKANRRGIPALAVSVILAAAVFVAGAVSTTTAANEGDAMALVKSTVNQAVAILQDHQTPTSARRQKLLNLVAGHFDFAEMARSSLGSHWRTITDAQKQQFVPLYTSFMEDVYLNKLEGYSGQKIEYLNQTSDGPGYSQVNTRAVGANGGSPIRINYRLKQEGGDWKVYDVLVEGISITANYRNQFNRVINNEGFDSLMSKMKAKQQELSASLGNGRASD
ncbi:MAG TPA: ABC transporter substrate-binding protein [Candidatus Binataceae bacterium]|nr:ABC transporter substrate-binding protein [Candidatus Binataceae bacterium]